PWWGRGMRGEDKARALRDHLMSPRMFSGWGIRTMAMGEGGYNPIEYHDGTVWPHDNSFIAAGLARYGFRKDAAKIIAGIFEASVFFDACLPEVFSWYDRGNTRFPVQYPTACIPQAWAAASPMLGIRTLLGLEPKGDVLTSVDDAGLPPWMGTLTLDGIPGGWGRAKVVAKGYDKAMLSMKQIYERLLAAREDLDNKELIA